MGLFVVAKADELMLDLLIIKKGKFVFPDRDSLANTWPGIQLVIVTEIVLINELINKFAAFTAE